MESRPFLWQAFQAAYNLWCLSALYLLGAYYVCVEINRKLTIFGKSKHFNADTDGPNDLHGKVSIITGGSRGIGWFTAKTLLSKGCHVIITSSAEPGPKLDSLYQSLASQADSIHGKLEVWHLELTSMDSVLSFIKRFNASGLELNLLINNAG